jgi:MFS family permease
MLLTALLGLGSAGPFAVWVPLVAAEQGAPARAISLLLALFPLGTLIGSLALRFVTATLPKRAALFAAHAAGSLCIAGAGLAHSFAGAVAGFALWGLCGAVFINCGRALLLEARPPAEHGRRLANLQLALLVSSPLGAVLGGVGAGWLGAHGSMRALGLAALAGAGAIALAGRAARRREAACPGARGGAPTAPEAAALR